MLPRLSLLPIALVLAAALLLPLEVASAQSVANTGTGIGQTVMLTADQGGNTPTRELKRDQKRVRIAVASRPIARGAVLSSEDFAVVDTLITWRWPGEPRMALPTEGWIAHRAIAAGETLRSPAVSPPAVISSGSTVVAVWQEGAVRIVVSGVATNTAALGDQVGVRVDRTRRLDGIAIAPDTVRLR